MKVKYQSILYFLLFLVFIGVLYKIFCIKESFKDLNTLDIVDTLVKQESETNFFFRKSIFFWIFLDFLNFP